MACAVGLAVLDVIEQEQVMDNADGWAIFFTRACAPWPPDSLNARRCASTHKVSSTLLTSMRIAQHFRATATIEDVQIRAEMGLLNMINIQLVPTARRGRDS